MDFNINSFVLGAVVGFLICVGVVLLLNWILPDYEKYDE
jgi:hypothetical protein